MFKASAAILDELKQVVQGGKRKYIPAKRNANSGRQRMYEVFNVLRAFGFLEIKKQEYYSGVGRKKYEYLLTNNLYDILRPKVEDNVGTEVGLQVNATSEVVCQVNMSKEDEDDMEKLDEVFLSEDMDEEGESLLSEMMDTDEGEEATLSEMDTDEELFDCGTLSEDFDKIFNFPNEAKPSSILSATEVFIKNEKKKAETSK